MGAMALQGLSGVERLIVAVRSDVKLNRTDVRQLFAEAGYTAEVLYVGETAHQVETVQRVLAEAADVGAFMIKDCDNSFVFTLQGDNAVATMDLHDVGSIIPRNKSYVMCKGDALTGIVEKQIVSTRFCCGGYAFQNPALFNRYALPGSTFISHVISNAVQAGEAFVARTAYAYQDWGTAQEWEAFVRSGA